MDIVRMKKILSSEITEMLREWIEREEKAHLVRELAQGYEDRRDEEKKLILEWDKTAGDGID
jgi:hypothetical protein